MNSKSEALGTGLFASPDIRNTDLCRTTRFETKLYLYKINEEEK